MMQSVSTSQIKRSASPFLKWAGGKSQLLDELDVHVPKFDRYFEPFLGGGALFFHLGSVRPSFKAYLSDINAELIETYRAVKTNVGKLAGLLRQHEVAYANDPNAFYYALRNARPSTGLERAARLIALNKTCYNGLYRVNAAGFFNVPIGKYKNPSICNEQLLKNASSVLRLTRAKISACDYAEALANASSGDFVYLDPPFVPLSKTASFVSYSRGGFSAADQKGLSTVFRKLDRRGCKVLLSNSDTPLTRELYSDFDQFRVKASRAINCRSDNRTGFTELLVQNYAP
jgi:DNA adenine methylase